MLGEHKDQLPDELMGELFFSCAEIDKFVVLIGKSLGCAFEKSVPARLKKATTFLRDEHLKIESYSDRRYFFVHCKCCHSF